MTNEEIIIRIRSGATDQEYKHYIAMLVKQNHGIIADAANKLKLYAEYDDLYQEGCIALMDAVSRYKPESGTFCGYAAKCIYLHDLRYLKQSGLIRLPVHMEASINTLQRFKAEYGLKYGKEPTKEEICSGLSITPGKLERILSAARIRNKKSIYEQIAGTDDITIAEVVADPADHIAETEEKIFKEERAAAVWNEVDALPEVQARVIRCRYQDGKTLKETGADIGKSYDRARQIEVRAIKELRKTIHAERLRPYIDTFYQSQSLKGSLSRFLESGYSSVERAVEKRILKDD